MRRGTVRFNGKYKTSVKTSVGKKDVCVFSFLSIPPDPTSWDSDCDYYGYKEIDWDFLDKNVYENLTEDEIDIIENILMDEMQEDDGWMYD